MRSRNTLLAVFTSIFSLVVVGGSLMGLRPPAPAPMVTALALSEDVEAGTVLTDEMLTEIKFPEKHLPAGAGTDRSKFVGKAIGSALPKDRLIFPSDLAPEDSPLAMQAQIPAGMRAYTIPLNSSSAGLAAFAVPGSRVDVLANPPATRSEIPSESEVVVENVKILAVDSGTTVKGVPATPKHMTLLLSQQQARRVDQALLHSPLRISLRNGGDLQTAEAPLAEPEPDRGRARIIPITIVRHNEYSTVLAKSRSGRPRKSPSLDDPTQIGQLGRSR
jgi:Flp pilus assembly protein CpaB